MIIYNIIVTRSLIDQRSRDGIGLKNLILTCLLSSLLFSCGKRQTPVIHSEQTPVIKGIETNVALATIDHDIVIESKYIKKHIFIMTTSVIENMEINTSQAFANKLVYFKINDNRVQLIETKNGIIDQQTQLIASFKIVKKSNRLIQFRFKDGMKTLLSQRADYTNDPNQKISWEITSNNLQNVVLKGKYIFVDQVLRVNYKKSPHLPKENKEFKVNFSFSTYNPNKLFNKRIHPTRKDVGFLKSHSKGLKDQHNILKFDASKEIVFHLSPSIPKKLKKIVTDGILYWNKAFGRKVIKVKNLDKALGRNTPGYNIINWIESDQLNYSYADIMGDPLTGEILQANIFISSKFYTRSYLKASQIYKRKVATNKSTAVKIKGFLSARIKEKAALLINDLQSIKDKIDNTTTDQITRDRISKNIADDFIRKTIAHEVGHALGLKHNFAASLESNINPESYNIVSLNYITRNKLLASFIPTSSVMDYSNTISSALIGSYIQNKRLPLSYDQALISYAYTNINEKDISPGLYCSDDDYINQTFLDCKKYDSFPNPFSENAFNFEEEIKIKAFRLISKLTNNKIVYGHTDAIFYFDKIIKPIILSLSPNASFISINKNFVQNSLELVGEKYYRKLLDFDWTVQKMIEATDLIISRVDPSVDTDFLKLRRDIYILNFSSTLSSLISNSNN